ncbi:DNA-3-methyladenine glycosylase I [Sphingomonas sp.]|uniref:DNA-3-methyladenine glycosylase I n=1 Tax=Sphingomonas sp. TaxID=28214 RepID=UPI001B091C49|nr:DNA-3-methyladenine glycosylase I [Sphingomonas sp.]MBO9712811.1 DNA-3-methyladenine glycosylase I [Sphingomonas sp.]
MVTRCAWAEGDPLMEAYHDREWGVPVRDSRLLWEMLMLEGFQAGLSWRTILHRREGFRRAFAEFDPVKVAAFDETDVARLMADPGIIRARSKIEATIAAANLYVEMAWSGESFSDWVWGLAGGAPVVNDGVHVPASTPVSEAISKALKARGFKFVGPVIVYAWMQAVGMVNDHAPGCFRRGEV